MDIWAVANQKGGVGKTTTTVTLAGLLAEKNKKTLIIDTDPHGSLTSYFGYDPDNMEFSIYSLFHDDEISVEYLIKRTEFDHIDLLPGSTSLATLDRQLGSSGGKGLVIHKTLEKISEKYDYAIIDCSPTLGILMVNALAACEQLIIPVQTEFLALKGLERMMQTVNMILASRKTTLNNLIVPTMYDRRTRASRHSLEILKNDYEDELWRSMIPVDTQFREASRVGLPVSSHAPKSRGANAYQSLLNDLIASSENRR